MYPNTDIAGAGRKMGRATRIGRRAGLAANSLADRRESAQTGLHSKEAHLQFHRLFSDDQGETHFEDARFDFLLRDFAPPAPAFYATDPAAAARYLMLELPAGWTSEAHPAPARQIFFVLAGALEVTASNGEAREIAAGDAWLMEDVGGKGHAARVVGAELFRAAVVQLD